MDDDMVTTNAKLTALEKELRAGRITFYNGEFHGQFSLSVQKELRSLGASFKSGVFKLTADKLPESIIESAKIGDERFTKKIEKIDKKLKDAMDKLQDFEIDLLPNLRDNLLYLDTDITKKMEAITIKADFSEEMLNSLALTYSSNLEKYVKDFAEEQIQEMRLLIQENFMLGKRSKSVEKTIQDAYGVSARKAKFLAKQETKLMTSAYQEYKYRQGGSIGYIWRCVAGSPLHPVRPDHKLLDGEFIEWDNPPVTNRKNGTRNHAGEDFGCRCMKIPVF